ncbi:MAG: 3-keto-5-aminohexanoate cleavage protein [Pseudomonadota bacterium]
MLQACLNGGRRAAPGLPVPETPAALAAEAKAVRAAGAEELHLHPRDGDGGETLAPAPVVAALEAVRAAVPGMDVGVGSGAWIAPVGRARHAEITAWGAHPGALPDYASVNLGEVDSPEVIALFARLGVAVEAGIWCVADAKRFLTEIDPGYCCRLLIEMPDTAPETALAEAHAVLDTLAPLALPRLLHGEGRSAWACIAEAARLGLDTRVGLEDITHLPDGTPAGNAALVAAAKAILDAP